MGYADGWLSSKVGPRLELNVGMKQRKPRRSKKLRLQRLTIRSLEESRVDGGRTDISLGNGRCSISEFVLEEGDYCMNTL